MSLFEFVTYRPYALWFIAIVLAVVNHWWSLWDLRDIDWNYVSFVYALIAPVMVAFAVGLLVPDRTGTGVINLTEHFLRIRTVFSRVLVGYTLVMWFDGRRLCEYDRRFPGTRSNVDGNGRAVFRGVSYGKTGHGREGCVAPAIRKCGDYVVALERPGDYRHNPSPYRRMSCRTRPWTELSSNCS